MFIENGFFQTNKFWKYLVGSFLIISASLIGQLPLIVAIFLKANAMGVDFPKESEIMNFLDSNTTLFFILLSFAVAFPVILLVIKYFHKQPIISAITSRATIDWGRVFFSFSLWALFVIGSTTIMYFLSPEDFVLNFKPIPFLILSIIGVVFIPIQTSTEELVFRGYLMQGFALLAKNRWFPLLMTSIVFGTMHIANPEVEKMGYVIMFYYIGTGLFLGIITLMDDGMELALGFHAANNLVTALLITSDWSAFQTHSILKDTSDPSVGFELMMPLFIIFPVLLFVFGKKYNWANWKEKLMGKIDINLETVPENLE